MKNLFSNFRIYKRECGFLFIFSILYNILYLLVSATISSNMATMVFLVILSILFTIGWYFIALKLWHKEHKITFVEGLQIAAFQGIYLLLTYGIEQLMYAFSSSAVGITILEFASGMLFILYPALLIGLFYHLVTKEKIHLPVAFIRNGMLMMILMVIVDTLLNGVFSFGSMDLWTLLMNLLLEGNPWFNWIMMVTINMMYQASAGMMLISMIVYFFVGLFYALLETNYAASIQRGNK